MEPHAEIVCIERVLQFDEEFIIKWQYINVFLPAAYLQNQHYAAKVLQTHPSPRLQRQHHYSKFFWQNGIAPGSKYKSGTARRQHRFSSAVLSSHYRFQQQPYSTIKTIHPKLTVLTRKSIFLILIQIKPGCQFYYHE